MQKLLGLMLCALFTSSYTLPALSSGLLFKVTILGERLSINTTPSNHTYPKVGIKINTSRFSIVNQAATCTMASNGYCLFSASDTKTKSIVIKGPSSSFTVTLCLNGLAGLSCQKYTNTSYQPALPPSHRLQWHQNFGYCGETSFTSTGLVLGQYTSQYTMRQLASPNLNQYDPNSQLLIGVNDASTANKVGYKHREYSNCSIESKQFLRWIKTQLYQGHPVVLGVYLNEYLFYKNQISAQIPCIFNPNNESCAPPLHCVPTGIPKSTSLKGLCQYGDPEYDHIVTAIKVTTQHPCTGVDQCQYFDDDTITIDDHGLYNSECDYGNPSLQCSSSSSQLNLCSKSKTSKYRYLYTYSFKNFQQSRKAANNPSGNVYSLSNTPITGPSCTGNYGITILGIKGSGLLPVKVSVNDNFECDMIQDESNQYYPVSGSGPIKHYPIELTVTVSNMKKNKQYVLYQYDDFSKVPVSHFNQNGGNSSHHWIIESSSGIFSKLIKIKNNQTAIFRAVPKEAP